MHDANHETSCSWLLYCVNAQSGINKLIFGTGTRLIIETSKQLLLSILFYAVYIHLMLN